MIPSRQDSQDLKNEMGPKAKTERRTSRENRERKARLVLAGTKKATRQELDERVIKRSSTYENNPISNVSLDLSGRRTQAKSDGRRCS